MTTAMKNETRSATPLNDQDKQMQPLPSEITPKDAKVKVFLAMQKAKFRFPVEKLKR